MAEVRNLDYIAWKNNLSWTESQKGKEWDSLIQNENKQFKKAVKPLRPSIEKISKELTKINTTLIQNLDKWDIISDDFSPNQTWKHQTIHFSLRAWDADFHRGLGYFAGAVQDIDGFERFTIEVYKIIDNKEIQAVKKLKNIGPDVAFFQDVVFFLGSTQDLRYDSLQSWDPKTDSINIVYTLSNPQENLELRRAQDGSIYLIASDFVNKRLGLISKGDVYWVVDKAFSIFVVSSSIWLLNGTTIAGLPQEHQLESISFEAGWVITRSYGIRTLWDISKNKAPVSMITVWGEISFDTRDIYILKISDIRYEPYIVKIQTPWVLSNPKAYDFPSVYYRYPAPTFVVYPKTNQVKGLLITAYGAYGTQTRSGSLISRWDPLLMRGWAIASINVPGSGDHDIDWKFSGQRQNRQYSIEMFQKAIRSLQEEIDIEPKKTCLYGRSAGGLLCISAGIQDSSLIGALYVESPYVDVLRTISNPSLPLTILETREFGIGTNPLNVITTAKWSPMEHIKERGFPELFVIARSDMSDLEVFPYEVVKWILRMRGKSDMRVKAGKQLPKLLFVDKGKGHFTSSIISRAEDLALLDGWLNNLTTRYKMPATRKNRSANRKNRSASRKNRSASRKNRNNTAPAVMMGGKRRNRSNRSRKNRK